MGSIRWGDEGEVSADGYCSLTFQNQFYFLGGSYSTQISRVENCKLERIGDLAIEMRYATCTATANEILMCFASNNSKQCYKGPTPFNITEPIEQTQYDHSYTYMSSSERHALAVGSGIGSVQNGVELLDLSTWQWDTRAAYPFETRIYRAPIIHVNGRFMLFGGWNGSTHLSRIAAYTPSTNEWTTEGSMKTARIRHGVINISNEYVVIGGYMYGQHSSEKCRYVNDQLECTYQNPTEPWACTHLFAVSSDFCNI